MELRDAREESLVALHRQRGGAGGLGQGIVQCPLVLSGEVIVGLTHELAAELGVIGWFDRVDSASNPVDKLSRGKMDGPWKLQRIRFPPRLFSLIDEFCE